MVRREAAQLRGRRARAALKAASVVTMPFLTLPTVFGTFGLAMLTDLRTSVWGMAVLGSAAIWLAFDERALGGPAFRYLQGSYNG